MQKSLGDDLLPGSSWLLKRGEFVRLEDVIWIKGAL
jgi:hypothetical protein